MAERMILAETGWVTRSAHWNASLDDQGVVIVSRKVWWRFKPQMFGRWHPMPRGPEVCYISGDSVDGFNDFPGLNGWSFERWLGASLARELEQQRLRKIPDAQGKLRAELVHLDNRLAAVCAALDVVCLPLPTETRTSAKLESAHG